MAIVRGAGTSFEITLVSTLTAVGQVVDITPPNMSHDTFSTTNLASAWQTYEAIGIPEGGESSFQIQYDPADTGHAELITLLASGAPNAMAIVLTDAGPTTISWSGIVTGFPLNQITFSEKVTCTVKVKVTGAVTFTVG